METFKGILESIPDEYKFLALILLSVVYIGIPLMKWFVIDKKKENRLNEHIKTSIHIMELVEKQNGLQKVLIRRYSDNLGDEQLSPFLNWFYQSFQFSIYVKFIIIQNLLYNHKVNEQEAKIQLKTDVENIADEFNRWLSLFKYKGVRLNDYWDKADVDALYDVGALELSKSLDIERSIIAFDRMIRKKLITMSDKIQNDEGVIS